MTRIPWAVLIFGVALIGLVSAPWLIGPERIVQGVGKHITGYDVTVHGSADLRIAARVTSPIEIVAEDISFALPDTHFAPVGSPPVLKVARIEMAINPWPLFYGRLNLAWLNLTRPGLHLAKDDTGSSNWSTSGKAPLKSGASGKSGHRRNIVVDAFSASDGWLRYADRGMGRDLAFDGVNLDAGMARNSEGLVFRVRGDARHLGEPIYLEAEIQRLEDFLSGTRAPFSLIAEAAPGRILFTGRGAMRNQPAVTADVQIDIDDPPALARLIPAVGADLSETAALRASLDLQTNKLAIDIRSLIYGRSDLSGTGEVDLAAPEPRVDLDLSAGAFDLMHFLGVGARSGLLPGPRSAAIRDWTVSGGMRLTWNRLIIDDFELGSGGAGLSWRAGRPNLAIEVSNLAALDGTIGGRAEITSNEGKSAVSLNLTGGDIEASKLMNVVTGYHGVAGRLHGKAEVLAVGATLREMFEAAGGEGRLSLTEGRVFGSDFQNAVSPEKRDLKLGRASMNFLIDAGVLESKDLLMDFDVGHSRASFAWRLADGDATIKFAASPLHEGRDGPPAVNGPLAEILRAK